MMSLLRGYRFYIVLVGVLFLSACSTTNSDTNRSFRLHESVQQPESGFVQLIIPAAVDILVLDGKEFKDSPGITEGHYQLELLPGKHSFKVIYSQNWGTVALGNLAQSGVFYFVLDAQAGNTYRFKHDGPEDLLYAEFGKSVDDIQIWLEEYNDGQQKIARKIDALTVDAYGNILSRYILGYSGAGAGSPEAAVQASVNQTQQKELNNVKQKASEQLKFWWKIANAEQRTAFEGWLVTLKEATVANSGGSMQQKALVQLKFWWKLADLKQRESFLLWVKK